ncbi:hypothetical protein [Almyronema epifaneia]|uniref:Glycosyltransferase RgtA/B/C/D-like domain-containing protein n=1 Tax=Almyronema epifaneia S1 TaxID=2991925 RepID=A0ABW6IFK0_9CYAN
MHKSRYWLLQKLTVKRLPFVGREILLTTAFGLLGLIGLLHHEMWRDELQAWLLVRDSSSLLDLYYNFQYEGHPALWYLCAYAITTFTHNPMAMQLFHLLVSASSIFLFVRFSPFSWQQKTLFCFGYFPFYEYNLISRNYAIGILFLFLFCSLYKARDKRILALAVCLAGLANTNFYALILSSVLAIALIVDLSDRQQLSKLHRQNPSKLLASGLIVILGWILAAVPILRAIAAASSELGVAVQANTVQPEKIGVKLAGGLDFFLTHLNYEFLQSLSYIWQSYVPIPHFKVDFWNSNIFDLVGIFLANWHLEDWRIGGLLTLIASLGLAFSSVRLLAAQRSVLLAYCLGSSLIIVCAWWLYPSQIRHYGHLFFLFLACIWMARSTDLSQPKLAKSGLALQTLSRSTEKKFITGLLVTQAIAGVFAYTIDLHYPFSMSRDVAEFIQAQGLETLPIVGYEQRPALTLSGYLDQPIYDPAKNQFRSFWTTRHAKVQTANILADAMRIGCQQHSAVLLVLTEALDATRLPTIQPLAAFDGPRIVRSEGFYLYLASPQAADQACS